MIDLHLFRKRFINNNVLSRRWTITSQRIFSLPCRLRRLVNVQWTSLWLFFESGWTCEKGQWKFTMKRHFYHFIYFSLIWNPAAKMIFVVEISLFLTTKISPASCKQTAVVCWTLRQGFLPSGEWTGGWTGANRNASWTLQMVLTDTQYRNICWKETRQE